MPADLDAQWGEVAKEDFATIRTGRANPALFQKILVDYYGTPTPLAQLASLQNPEARTILITPYDKGALKEIEHRLIGREYLYKQLDIEPRRRYREYGGF
jgi:ribosome recycling factor